MYISPLSPDNQSAALGYLRAAPYRNALPLSNMTQLRTRSEVLVAKDQGRVLGVGSTYHDLPMANLTFAANNTLVVGELIAMLAQRTPRLRVGPVFALLPPERFEQLAQHVHILEYEIEYQMVAEPESLHAPSQQHARRLTHADVPQLDALAEVAGLSVWHRSALDLGPAFGCFVDGRLVAMAATHFATPEIVEIGHVATHPDYRRQGYASDCTAALAQLAFKLAPRVFLMVLAKNTAALNVYKQLGFHILDRMHATQFTLDASD